MFDTPVRLLEDSETLKQLNGGEIAPGDIFTNSYPTGSAPMAGAYVADQFDICKFEVKTGFTTATIEIDVQTAAAAGKRCRLGIFADDNNKAGALLTSSPLLAVNTVGIKTWTVGFTFKPSTAYWLGIHSEDVVSVYSIPQGFSRGLGYDKVNHNTFTLYRSSVPFANGLPANYSGGSKMTGPTPMFIFTVAP